MTTRIRKVLLLLSLVLLICLTACVKENVSDFTADWTCFAVGEDGTITFTVKASRSPILFMGNNEIGSMHDDGRNGDEVENDGIYSITVEASATEEKTEVYHATVGKNRTEDIKICYYDHPTDSETRIFETEEAVIYKLNERLLDENGFIADDKKEEALNNVVEYANTLKEKGLVTECRKNADNVYIRFSSGLTSMYIPDMEETLEAGNDIQMQIITCEPYRSQFPNVSIDNASLNIAKELNNCTIYNMIDNDVVTTDTVKKEFKSNRIVMWLGHGSFDPLLHSVIITGEPAVMMFLDLNDFVTERIILAGGRIAFTSKFIDKYCSNMENSVFYFNCCSSGKDDTLANAFLNKGASAFVGNTETIRAIYASKVQEEVFAQMICPNGDSSAYNTLAESLHLAKEKYGQDDAAYGGKDGAQTVIFGDGSVRLSNGKPSSKETLIYRAYANVLSENEQAIRGYSWQNGYYGYGEITEDKKPRPISFSDVNGNGIPELIFVAQDPEYESLTRLHIFEYKDGNLAELYNDKWDYLVGGGFNYFLFKIEGDESLYAYYSKGDAWFEDYYAKFEADKGGALKLKQLYKYSNHEGKTSDYNVRDIHYYEGENECDERIYEAGVKEITECISEIIMNNAGIKVESNRFKSCALDYEQAMEYLLDKTSPNAKGAK